MSAVEETLALEAEQRPRAFAYAAAAAALTLGGGLIVTTIQTSVPSPDDGTIGLTESLGSRLEGREPEGPGFVVRQVEYFGDNALALGAGHVLFAIGTVLAMLALAYVYRATVARNPATTKLARFAIGAGLVLFPVGLLLHWLPLLAGAAGFDGGTAEEARNAVASSIGAVGQLLELFGTFGVGLAFILVSLNAMRVGLLTRFLGILGVLVGFLVVLPFGGGAQVVRAIWLGALALLISGRGRAGLLPAWQTGRAEPWPSQQQLREQRDAQRGASAPAPAPEPEAATPEGAVSAQRRKRKRRK